MIDRLDMGNQEEADGVSDPDGVSEPDIIPFSPVITLIPSWGNFMNSALTN